MRAGAHALTLLAVPLNVHVLRALAEEPMPLVALRRAAGSPPETTMRGHLRALGDLGIVERRRQNASPGSVDYELGSPGRSLLEVARVLEAWLATSPEGPVTLGTPAAKNAVKALADGWSSNIVRALAARPLSLTELSRLISGFSYPSLERRLTAMRLAGQIEPCPGRSRGTPYRVTDWLRRGVGPILAAAGWERQHRPPEATPVGRLDIEATFLLAAPLLRLPTDASGGCRLGVELQNGNGAHRLTGVSLEVEDGRVISCVARLQGQAQAWASGSISTWLRVVTDEDIDRLEIGGDCELVMNVVEGLSGTLMPDRRLN